ncbi:methyltransferase domain-containing protein [Paenarthrobacter sp. PH39-S1]|uniref:methyltransferase domain-containing protein n=1 Tax=Paenarthrobacter sp. PH39-S1 TaxID=3046204 RepID=UPI0024B95EA0|nr:methyltransferase domain-containing protein [Paenarthrobacter sp. PH39-S1]MDJ0354782.1 methyltransferase domain-containing protein [Paenarthrobacter sp. PH39-S1]
MSEHGPSKNDVYTHGHHESVLRSHAARSAANSAAYLVPHLTHGLSVLDVGSGPGTITADFARLVAPGEVIGLDRAPEVVAQAQALAAEQHLDNLSFLTGNIYDLDFTDGQFDVVHAHQVLQHLTDPVAALREMRRVTKPGGIVAVRDADFHGMSWYPQLPELDDWMSLYQELARHNRAEPDAGRRLISWAQAAGFTDITPSSASWLYATDEQRQWHAEVWADRIVHSAFAKQALNYGLADRAGLERISAGWRVWGAATDGWFLIPNGEVIARA